MASATASAIEGSIASPFSSVRCRRLKMSLGGRWRCTATEKTLAANGLFVASVRSTAPSWLPLGLHLAAVTFCCRSVRDLPPPQGHPQHPRGLVLDVRAVEDRPGLSEVPADSGARVPRV